MKASLICRLSQQYYYIDKCACIVYAPHTHIFICVLCMMCVRALINAPHTLIYFLCQPSLRKIMQFGNVSPSLSLSPLSHVRMSVSIYTAIYDTIWDFFLFSLLLFLLLCTSFSFLLLFFIFFFFGAIVVGVMVFSSGEGIKGPLMPMEKSKTLMVQLYFVLQHTQQTHTHTH